MNHFLKNVIIAVLLCISFTAKSQSYLWGGLNSTTSQNLTEMFFANNFQGYVGGEAGTFARTLDGLSWLVVGVPTTHKIEGIYFTGPTEGYIVDEASSVFKTTNAGDDWTTIHTGSFGTDLGKCITVSAGKIFVGRDNEIIYSPDDGVNWYQTACPVGQVNSIVFDGTGTVGFACGELGQVAITTNGGTSWTPTTGNTNISQDLYDIELLSTGKIIAVGDLGKVIYSTDDGATWDEYTHSITTPLRAIDFADALNGLIVGDNDIYLETTDGGSNWGDFILGSGADHHAVSCRSDILGYTCGTGGDINRAPDGVEDITGLTYTGEDSVCVGEPFDFSFTFVNTGQAPSFNPGFTTQIIGGGSVFGNLIYYNGTVNPGDTVEWTGTASINTQGIKNVIIFCTTESNNQSDNQVYASINVIPPSPTSITDGAEFCPGDTIQLEATGGDSYYWISGITGSDPYDPIQEETPTQTTTYSVEIYQPYCTVTESTTFTLNPACSDTTNTDSTAAVPKESYAFSPNGDGVNDVMVFDFLDGDSINSVIIYNRWGDEVFQTIDYDNVTRVWDGTYNGRISPAGTYFFVASTSKNGAVRGWIQLVK